MPHACRRIGELVTRIQNAFLDDPALALTASQARKRFGMDAVHSRALFELLTDAGVLVPVAEGGDIKYRLPQRENLHDALGTSRARIPARGFDGKPTDAAAA